MFEQMIGQTLDRYQLVSLLGEGQLGATYRAFDPRLQRVVAIKLIRLPETRPDLADDLMQQARLAARLNYPGLVKIHDFGRSGPWLYVVMDYLPGANLAQLLQDLRSHNQWLLLAEAVGLVRQLALALDELSRQGLPPRAIKPADVMLTSETTDGLPFRAVLTNLALEPREPASPGGWRPNDKAPAPAYAYWSPEQSMGQPLDARSQVYSLGALLYELCVGWQPFPAETAADAVRLHTQSAPPAPRSRRADLPEPLEAVILKALEKDPAQRYPDPAALAQVLAEVVPLAQAVDRNTAAGGWAESLLTPYQRSLEGAQAVGLVRDGEAGHHTSPGRSFYNFNGTVVDANLVQTSPDGHVGVYVEVAQLTVTPGQPTSTAVVVVNLGTEPDHFSIGVGGVPPAWLAAPLPPTSLALAAGESRRLTVAVAPPRSSASRAGRYSLALRAASQTLPDQEVEAKISLTVAAFSQFRTALSADSTQAGAPMQLVVTNDGNASEAYAVNFEDPSDKLAFDPAGLNFSVPEGQEGVVNFIVRRRQPRLIGDRRAYPFGVRVATAAGPEQKLMSEVVTHALLPLWVPLVALFLCCAVAGASALAYGGLQANASNTATAIAEQTANAVMRETISAVGTALALTGTATSTVTPTATVNTPTPSDTPTGTLTPLPATASNTPLPATPSNTPLPATATPPPPTGTASPLPPTATPLPPSPTATLAPTSSPTALPPSSTPAVPPPATGRLLFVSSRSGQPNLYLMNADGTGVTPLSTAGANQDPVWSAAAQRVAFVSTRDGNSQIYSMHLDGSSQTRLTNNSAADTSPAWSPDGSRIAFVSNRDGNPEIYVMNADGSGQTRLTNNSASDTAPVWSPDGTRLAFITDRDGNPELYVMSADGSNQKRLTNDPEPESQPAWSPNGSWIAYVRGSGTSAEIYISVPDGSGQLRLTNNSAADTQPAWSPDSSHLAFVSERDGNPEIYTMLADGSAQTRLTNSAGRDDNPLWSPNGSLIAFSSDRDGFPQVYIMKADGSAQTRLTNDGATDLPAVWLPQ